MNLVSHDTHKSNMSTQRRHDDPDRPRYRKVEKHSHTTLLSCWGSYTSTSTINRGLVLPKVVTKTKILPWFGIFERKVPHTTPPHTPPWSYSRKRPHYVGVLEVRRRTLPEFRTVLILRDDIDLNVHKCNHYPLRPLEKGSNGKRGVTFQKEPRFG